MDCKQGYPGAASPAGCLPPSVWAPAEMLCIRHLVLSSLGLRLRSQDFLLLRFGTSILFLEDLDQLLLDFVIWEILVT